MPLGSASLVMLVDVPAWYHPVQIALEQPAETFDGCNAAHERCMQSAGSVWPSTFCTGVISRKRCGYPLDALNQHAQRMTLPCSVQVCGK